MTTNDEVKDFLSSRRARITPDEAGLPTYGGNRRVPGLRREEVALLAGVSVDYYTKLERGNLKGASEEVLESLVRALQLDEAERAHLFDLARAASAAPARRTRRRAAEEKVRPAVQRVLDSLIGAPAFVVNGRLEILAANRLGEAFYSDMYDTVALPVNTARFTFLDPRATEFFVDWDRIADDAVGILRTAAGRDPFDRRLSDLIGELSTRSEDFRTRWAAHPVNLHRTGVKHFRHPLVGELTLGFESLDLSGDPGQKLLVYTAEPASPSQEALNLLASWASTPEALPDGARRSG
ncbi:MAG: helix-turn-helix transcriptional regulator [Actinomycetota bacterium]|nr:helix-turn-helix transcriptional regulator [Actinomycetota bacterium]